MGKPSGPLRRLAARLARDRRVDWDAEERGTLEGKEHGAIRQLRTIAAIAGFHRSAQGLDSSTDLAQSISVARGIAGGTVGDGDPAASTSTSGPARASGGTALPAGSRWGHLEILEEVGRGAFGVVYRARDTRLDRIVALKILSSEAAGLPEETVREARLLARVHHPNVVTVYGADRVDGRVGIWMEYLHGETLDRIVRSRGPLDSREAALIGIDLCRALSAVHAAGIAHQDVKPGNVIRAEGGRIILMDFGLGRETERARHAGVFGMISGTPLFMAPEVLHRGRADTRSDVYSLGVVLFFLVTGALPLEATTLRDLLAKHERREMRRARDLRPDLPESFAHVLDRSVAPDPKSRFGTAGEVEHALLHALGATVQPAQPGIAMRGGWWKPVVAVVSVGILAIALSWILTSRRHAISQAADRPESPPYSDNPSLTLIGDMPGAFFGGAVAGVGDVDGDGFDDILVGAPHASGEAVDAGAAFLYRGSKTGLDPHPAWTMKGTVPGERLGWSIASVTNLSFDGFADLVIGAPGTDEGPPTTGRVYVYPGARSGPASEPAQVLSDGLTGTLYGYSIATGDVDHDGDDDLLVGEPAYPSLSDRRGRALLYLANASTNRYATTPAWIAEGPPGSQFGCSVDMSGDVNGDGYRDAVIGAMNASPGPDQTDAGAVYVYLGSPTGLDSIPIIIPGRQKDAESGRGVLIPGDLDGDGYGDLLVGAENASNGEQQEGIVEIFFGSKTGISPYNSTILESNVAGANFGGHLGTLRDVNGDGCIDFFVGAVRYQRTQPREGAAYVFAGSPRRDIRRVWFRVCGKAGSWYGGAGGSAGDVNGDGLPDLVVAAPSWDTDSGENAGRVDLFLHKPKR